jgi:hypothetical protein
MSIACCPIESPPSFHNAAALQPTSKGKSMSPYLIRSHSMLLAVVAFLGASVSSGLQAQAEPACRCSDEPISPSSQRALVLKGGGWHVDFDATVLAARAELPMGRSGRWLFVPGVTFAHGDLKTSPTQTDVLVPEAHFHYQLAQGQLRPYVGGGAGLSLVNLLDRTINGVVTVASGLRADLTSQWGARVEADVRFFGFEAGSVGWSLGIARRF